MTDQTVCECINWARDGRSWISRHHPNCPNCDLEGDAIYLIKSLLKAMRDWAADEDGVHPDACEAYDKAAVVVGEPTLLLKAFPTEVEEEQEGDEKCVK